MLVILARPMNASAMIPKTAPPSGTIQTVGSSDFSASAANAPTIAATTDARNRPTKLGQNVVRDVRLSRDRLPTFGHHANPPAILSSIASMNAVCRSEERRVGKEDSARSEGEAEQKTQKTWRYNMT